MLILCVLIENILEFSPLYTQNVNDKHYILLYYNNNNNNNNNSSGPSSVVGIATAYGLDGPGIE